MLQIRSLNDDLQREANEKLNEVPARIHEDLRAFRIWIEEQPHLCANTDDQFLIAFLRGCKYSTEKAKTKIDTYYTLKTKFPDCFNVIDIDSARFREIFRMGVFLLLPIPLHNNGPRILLMRGGIPPADTFSIEEVMAVSHVLQDIALLEDDYAVVSGLIFFHNSLDSLSQDVPLKYLPKEYGGENGSIAEIIAEWDKKLDEYRDYFKKSSQWGIDEKLRIGKTKDSDDMFGFEGSFRKLENLQLPLQGSLRLLSSTYSAE
uniref:CRAL_TRIO_N domain-containing protein n=1 Tax=Glossina brevipalpis TaxID=37001 RepID=A0A1A9X126_9MUSC